jgi:paired amphipathic helix protein Sin3a
MERQCFELIKEAFALGATTSASARDGWTEFLSCIDLFSQDLIQRFELVLLITELFSSRGLPPELLADLKKLLQNHGSSQNDLRDDFSTPVSNRSRGAIVQESFLWFSTPMHEIDFSRCKLGTPSYRALPASMPRAKCGKRSSLDMTVLNDAWVSQPIGSEETHSFKHVRKNHHEEVLFKCEDERYELDMIIDSNTSTISALKFINDQIRWMDTSRVSPMTVCPINVTPLLKAFTLDSSALTTSHLNVIVRVYGEHGAELIELLNKNPTSTVPIVLCRLKQKDEEWRAILRDLVNIWKEEQQQNIMRAMDNRSFYFHHKEKKTSITRYLVQEILGNKSFQMQSSSLDSAQQAPDSKPALSLQLRQHAIHRLLLELANDAVEQSSMSQQEKMNTRLFWRTFLAPFLRMPESVLENSIHPIKEIPAADLTSHREANRAPIRSNDLQLSLFEELSVVERDGALGDLSLKSCSISDEDPTDQPRSCVGTHYLYVFFRLYHHLFERFQLAYDLCESTLCNNDEKAPSAITSLNGTQTHSMLPHTSSANYNAFLSILRGFVGGSLDAAQYEDCCQRLIGAQTYLFLNLDKLIVQLLKQLQLVMNDLTSRKLIALWQLHEKHKTQQSRPMSSSDAKNNVVVEGTLLNDDSQIAIRAPPTKLTSLYCLRQPAII